MSTQKQQLRFIWMWVVEHQVRALHSLRLRIVSRKKILWFKNNELIIIWQQGTPELGTESRGWHQKEKDGCWLFFRNDYDQYPLQPLPLITVYRQTSTGVFLTGSWRFYLFFKLGEFHAGLEKKRKKLGMEIGNKGVKGGGLDCVLRKAVPAPHCS